MSNINDINIDTNTDGVSFGERFSRYLSRTFRRNGNDEYHRLTDDDANNNNASQTMPGAFPSSGQSSLNETRSSGTSGVQLRTIPQKLLFGAFFLIYAIFRIFQLILMFIVDRLPSALNRSKSVRKRGTNPSDVARNFIYNFDKRIGNIVHYAEGSRSVSGLDADAERESDLLIPSNDLLSIPRPDFLECSYSQALYFAKKEIRWLMIYLHSDEHEDTDSFINELLLHPRFLKYIKSRDFLVWGGDIRNSECFQVANSHNITQLPVLGLLCLTVKTTPTSTGVIQSTPVLSFVCKLQKSHSNKGPDISRCIKIMEKTYRKFNPTLVALRAEQQEQNMARNIRSQQDMAYNEALERDRQRREERLQREEEERRQRELTLKKAQWLKWRKSKLLEEVPMNMKGEYSRVAIRLVDGRRITFRFAKDCKLEEIYALIECKYLNEVEDISDSNIEPPSNYEHKYGFTLYQTLPKELLECSTEIDIKDSELVWPNGNLIIEMDE